MGINLGNTAISDLKVGDTQVDKVCLGEEIVWQKTSQVKALKFELIDPTDTTATLTITRVNTPTGRNFEYSADGNTWNTVTLGSTLTYTNGVIYIRGMNVSGISKSGNYIKFSSSGISGVNCSGNIMHLIDYTQDRLTIPNTYCFYQLFRNNSKLVTAPSLPATTLANYCYGEMFSGCTSLTTAPELPATTLANNCYGNMFNGCTSLTTAPALPATTLANNCYIAMFSGCTSLTTAPALPATTLAEHCYESMFEGCSSLTTAPALPATTLATSCYFHMFQDCSSLTTAPALPATTLATSCYYYMFNGCNSLRVSDIQTSSAQYAWVIPTQGQFSNSVSYAGTFSGCAGTRSSDSLVCTAGQNKTYYTQNQPVQAS